MGTGSSSSMGVGSLKELYLAELGDLYDAETQKMLTLARLSELSRTPELREALTRQCVAARLHLERLELIFTHWSEVRHGRRCMGLAGIVQEADSRVNAATTDVARDAAIIGAARGISHYEIAAYGVACMYARWLNRMDDARLLEETLDEKERADRRLTDIAEARVGASAA
ncbi:MAG TPA: DUF892 family protein [Vicinamibacterales bacterium]|nr:DUF892 family protein [Vicinamibacterales bacterium]